MPRLFHLTLAYMRTAYMSLNLHTGLPRLTALEETLRSWPNQSALHKHRIQPQVAKNPKGSMAKPKVVENDMGFSAHQRVNSFS